MPRDTGVQSYGVILAEDSRIAHAMYCSDSRTRNPAFFGHRCSGGLAFRNVARARTGQPGGQDLSSRGGQWDGAFLSLSFGPSLGPHRNLC